MAEDLELSGDTGSSPLFGLALASAVGIALAWATPWPPAYWAGGTVLCAAVSWWSSERLRFPMVLALVLVASGLWYQARVLSLPSDHLSRLVDEETHEVRLRFEVVEDPVVRNLEGGAVRADFRARVLAVGSSGMWETGSGRIFCRAEAGTGRLPAYGDVWEGWGDLNLPTPPSNPGQFDYAAWLKGQGILYEFGLREGNGTVVSTGGGWWVKRMAVTFKHHMRRILSIGLEERPEATGLMAAMLFGFRDGVAEPVEEAFRVTGTMHLFAVSGQNVGIILGMLVLVLRTVGLIRWRWSWLVLPLVLIFCLSTGMQPSAFRAFVMAALVSVGWALYRPVGLFNVLGGAALFMFLWDPRILFDLGFQLSFIVLLGIAALSPPLLRLWVHWGRPDPWIPRRLLPWWRVQAEKVWRVVGLVVSVSLAAWLASLPHGLWYFHLFAPVALLANILVVPLASAVLGLSAISVVAGSLWSQLALVINHVNAFLLQGMVGVIGALAAWPGGHVFVALPWDQPPRETLRLTVLHDRQAAPVVMQVGGRAFLADPGPVPTWDFVLNSFRRWQGINRWDMVVLGNGGSRRMGSASKLLEEMPVAIWIDSGWRSRSSAQHRWLDGMQEKAVGKTFWRAGDRFDWPGGWRVEVLWPGGEMPWERLEDRGLVFRLAGPGGCVLFAGDISLEVEQELLQQGANVRADVLVQGEHPNRPNLSTEWLEKVSPRHLVRPGRGYQPDRSLDHVFWEDARRLGVEVLRQDVTGAVVMDFSSNGLVVRPFRAGP